VSKNSNLTSAKRAKNDEFYTQFADIQKEMNAYLEFDPDVFRDKTILLPCDDPEWSNFTLFFAQNFESFGIKKLISTSYVKSAQLKANEFNPSDLESSSDHYDPVKSANQGKIFTLTKDVTRDGKIDIDDLEWAYLEGDGDFRSEELLALRAEADLIITNPPFSLFREFVAWLSEANKKFIVVGSMNAITYKEIFPLIKENKLWLGVNPVKEFLQPNGSVKKFGNILWYTNLDHGRRHQPIDLMTTADNLRYSKRLTKRLKGKDSYEMYTNYNAIEVPYVDAIPSDHEGVMGVPITFLSKYCPDQFEILGMCENEDLYSLKTRIYAKEDCKHAYFAKFGRKGTYDLNASGVLLQDGLLEKVYQRILIKHRSQNQ